MLVIRRRSGESILIGDEIELEVLETSGSQVKLGIRAPRSVKVLRKEIALVSDQNRVASGFSKSQMENFVRSLTSSSILPRPDR